MTFLFQTLHFPVLEFFPFFFFYKVVFTSEDSCLLLISGVFSFTLWNTVMTVFIAFGTQPLNCLELGTHWLSFPWRIGDIFLSCACWVIFDSIQDMKWNLVEDVAISVLARNGSVQMRTVSSILHSVETSVQVAESFLCWFGSVPHTYSLGQAGNLSESIHRIRVFTSSKSPFWDSIYIFL